MINSTPSVSSSSFSSSSPEPYPLLDMPINSQEENMLEKAESYLASGLVVEAADLFKARLETEEDPVAHMGLVRCAYLRQNLHEALSHLQAVSTLDPDFPDLANNMGVILYELGMSTQAEDYFKTAAEQEPDNVQPWQNLRDLAEEKGDHAVCVEYCQRILTLDPSDIETQHTLQSAQRAMAQEEPVTPDSESEPAESMDVEFSSVKAALDQVVQSLGQAEPVMEQDEVVTEQAEPAIEQAEPAMEQAELVRAAALSLEEAATDAVVPRMGMIQGVVADPRAVNVDDRGYLIEILRADDEYFTRFGQVYLVGDVKAGTIRAFHKHEELWDYFFITHGAAKFVLVDDREESPTYGNMQTFVTGERNSLTIVVPPGVFHGWMALADDTQLISTASEVYNAQSPDEVRIPPDSYGDVWSVKGR